MVMITMEYQVAAGIIIKLMYRGMGSTKAQATFHYLCMRERRGERERGERETRAHTMLFLGSVNGVRFIKVAICAGSHSNQAAERCSCTLPARVWQSLGAEMENQRNQSKTLGHEDQTIMTSIITSLTFSTMGT